MGYGQELNQVRNLDRSKVFVVSSAKYKLMRLYSVSVAKKLGEPIPPSPRTGRHSARLTT
jgi:hypothetical protein